MNADYNPYSNPVRYNGQFSFSVVNDSCSIEQLEVWLPKILEWDNQRDIIIHRITPQVLIDTADAEGKSGIYYWKFNSLPYLGNSIKMSIDFSFASYEINYQIDPEKVGQYNNKSKIYIDFTKNEPFLECGNTEIQKLAKEIVGSEINPYIKARKMYEWILDNIDYQFVPGLKGAIYALQNRHGECGDYAAFFVALCRATGIPARPVIGMWANPFNEPHVWAEFYLPNYGWIPVDASQADGWGDVDNYFGHLDNRRIIFSKGFNVSLVPKIQIETLPIFQLGAWWYEGEEGGIYEKISVSFKAEEDIQGKKITEFRSDKYGLELNLPPGWEITSIGGRGRYNLCIEIWNESKDCRVYLYGREWRTDEPRRTPKEITLKDIEFFKKNSSPFVLLHHGPENFKYVRGCGFLAIMSSYGISQYYSRYVYFTKDDFIFWLIFHSIEENYMHDIATFYDLGNSLKTFQVKDK